MFVVNSNYNASIFCGQKFVKRQRGIGSAPFAVHRVINGWENYVIPSSLFWPTSRHSYSNCALLWSQRQQSWSRNVATASKTQQTTFPNTFLLIPTPNLFQDGCSASPPPPPPPPPGGGGKPPQQHRKLKSTGKASLFELKLHHFV